MLSDSDDAAGNSVVIPEILEDITSVADTALVSFSLTPGSCGYGLLTLSMSLSNG